MGVEVLGAMLPVLILAVIAQVLFTLNLQRTLQQVDPANRAMSPELVWLNFIPLVGLIYVVVKMRDSLRREYRARGWPTDGDFGLNIGIAAAVLEIMGLGASVAPARYVPMMLVLISGALACGFVYWAHMVAFRNRLSPPEPAGLPPVGPGGGPSSGAWFDDDSTDEEEEDAPPVCPACGSWVKEGDRFCYVCGSRLPPDDEEE